MDGRINERLLFKFYCWSAMLKGWCCHITPGYFETRLMTFDTLVINNSAEKYQKLKSVAIKIKNDFRTASATFVKILWAIVPVFCTGKQSIFYLPFELVVAIKL